MITVMGSLTDRVAIVTGGTRGIGRAVVEALLADGARVAFCGRDDAAGRAVERELGPGSLFVRADVAVEDDVERLVAATADRLGAPTVLVANAGVNANFDAETMSVGDWSTFMGTDLMAAWLLAKHGLPHLRGARGGSIVVISSIHAVATLRGWFPYAAAKAGLVGLARSLALDYGPDGIRANVVCPGFTRTRLVQASLDRNPDPAAAEAAMTRAVALGRIAEPAEIASVVGFLAGPGAAYLTGETIVVDGGLLARRPG
jgi:NAD(P)-dependent dehydrogenase (short-subunit alcohol dehydrogenase family)